jgi:hypothetical protein
MAMSALYKPMRMITGMCVLYCVTFVQCTTYSFAGGS